MTPTEPAAGPAGPHAHGPDAGPAEYVIRGAAESDLDGIAQFEIEIAKVSFSDDAIVDPALDRRRVSGSLSKPGEIMLVAQAGQGTLIGWAWPTCLGSAMTSSRAACSETPHRAC